MITENDPVGVSGRHSHSGTFTMLVPRFFTRREQRWPPVV